MKYILIDSQRLICEQGTPFPFSKCHFLLVIYIEASCSLIGSIDKNLRSWFVYCKLWKPVFAVLVLKRNFFYYYFLVQSVETSKFYDFNLWRNNVVIWFTFLPVQVKINSSNTETILVTKNEGWPDQCASFSILR